MADKSELSPGARAKRADSRTAARLLARLVELDRDIKRGVAGAREERQKLIGENAFIRELIAERDAGKAADRAKPERPTGFNSAWPTRK